MSGLEQAALINDRAQLRRSIAAHVVYAQPTQRPHNAFVQDGSIRTVVLNFAAGIDFPVGAEHWFDLALTSQTVLSKVLNALAWLSGSKHGKPALPAARAASASAQDTDIPVRYEVTYTHEAIPSDDPVAPRCAGYRLWIDMRAKPPTPDVQLLLDEAAAAAGEDAPRAGTAALQRKAAAATLLRKKWLDAPLTMGCQRSFSEAVSLDTLAGKIRSTSKKPVPVPNSLRSYRWAGQTTAAMFHFSSLVPFFCPHDSTDMPVDPFDEFLFVGDGEAAEHPSHKRSPFNLDQILTKERAMVYKTTGGEYKWAVNHCRLDSYMPGAVARAGIDPDADGRLPMTAYVDDTTGEYKQQYIDVIDRAYPTPRLVYSLSKVGTLAEVLLPFVALPWPIGAVLPPAALQAEMGASMLLPDSDNRVALERQLDAVARLRDIEAQHGNLGPMAAEGDLLDAAQLKELSSKRVVDGNGIRARPAINAAITQPIDIHVPTLAQTQRRLDALSTPRRSQMDEEEAIDQLLNAIDKGDDDAIAAAGAAIAAEPDVPGVMPAEKKHVFDEQRTYVRTHFHRMHDQFARRLYDEFNVEGHHVTPWVSTHTSIGIDDLVRTQRGSEQGEHEIRILAQLNQHAEASSTTDVPITTDMKDRVMERVDVIPSIFVERNDFLAERAKNQIKRGMMNERHGAERERLARVSPNDAEALEKLMARQSSEKNALQQACWAAHFSVIHKTDNAPPAFLKARDYATQHLMSASTQDSDLHTLVDGDSLAHMYQFLIDSFVAVEPVSAQNMPYLFRAYLCGFHAHRYKPNRADPATNYLLAGTTGTGKSYLLNRVARYALDGIVQNTTMTTTASFNVEQDFDHEIIIQEEMEYDLLVKPGMNEKGNSDKLNYTKARMTSFCTWTQYFFSNPETGQREARKCVSSQHVVMLAATNQPLDGMDAPMKRRLIVDYVFEISAPTDGGKPEDNETFSLFLDTGYGKHVQRKHHEIHWAYMVVETAIRSGVIDDVLDDASRLHLRCVLADARRTQHVLTGHATRTHWVLELARTIAILDACYTALYSADCLATYEFAESGIRRWTPSMFNLVVTQRLAITKSHVMLAVEAFDFFYASRDDQRLLGTLAENVCHMSEPSMWTFRRLPAPASVGGFEIDPNYLIVVGASNIKIAERISDAHKNIAEPRPEDVLALFNPYAKITYASRGLEAVRGQDGKVQGLRHNKTAPIVSRPVLFFENDQATTSNKTPMRQLSVSVEFIESRFNLDLERNSSREIREALCATVAVYDAKYFASDAHGGSAALRALGRKLAEGFAKCTDARAPLVGPIRRTLSHPVLERSPYEHDELLPVPPACFRHATFYVPDDVRVQYAEGAAPLRIPQHGSAQILELRRDRKQASLRYEDHALPLPTAQASIFNNRAGDEDTEDDDGALIEKQAPARTHGFVVGTYDPDFDMAVVQMRKYGHPGIPFLEAVFIKACRAEAGDDEERWQDMLEAIPELGRLVHANKTKSNRVNPLPFTFGPIAYRIKRYIRQQQLQTRKLRDAATTEYSAVNIFARIQNEVTMRLATEHKTPNVFEDYSSKVGVAATFLAPIAGPAKRKQPPPPNPESPERTELRGRHKYGRYRYEDANPQRSPENADEDAMDIDH